MGIGWMCGRCGQRHEGSGCPVQSVVQETCSVPAPAVTVHDAVKVPEAEWDGTPEEMRYPYREAHRKNGYVYGIADR